MDYKVIVTEDVHKALERYVAYLIDEKKNLQAARSLVDDYEGSLIRLTTVAGSLKPCDNPKLAKRGLHRINFKSHNYFLLYYIEDTKVYTVRGLWTEYQNQ